MFSNIPKSTGVILTRAMSRFADRDMYMRHKGGGVGHCAIQGLDIDRDTGPVSEAEMEVDDDEEQDVEEDAFHSNDSDEDSGIDSDEESDSDHGRSEDEEDLDDVEDYDSEDVDD